MKKKQLSDKDKIDALEQIKTLAEIGAKPTRDEEKNKVRQAMKLLKFTSTLLPDTAKLIDSTNKLLPLLPNFFQ